MNIHQALLQATSLLSEISDTAKLDAEILLAHSLQKNRTFLYTWPDKDISAEIAQSFSALIQKRQQGTPIAHLTGYKEFWGLEFKVNEHTLIPRPDTECLVEAALNKLATLPSATVLDLGTGSGAIICALKHELTRISATAVDLQPEALEVAQYNANKHQLQIEFKQSDWFSAVKQQSFDVIVSNPPYIEEEDPHLFEGDVRFDPITALTSGKTGLEDIQQIVKNSCHHLTPNGWLLIEHGYNQQQSVQQIFSENGFKQVETITDYQNNPRVTLGQLAKTYKESFLC